MKEIMVRRIPLFILLAIQALGGGAITLAHARDVVVAPVGIEAGHDARCAILHDEVRCALCHYASARVIAAPTFTVALPATAVRFIPVQPVAWFAAAVKRTGPPPRAPPPVLS